MTKETLAMIWPKTGVYKIAQIYLDRNPVIIFGERPTQYHSDILKKFLEKNGIKPKINRMYNIPVPQDERYKVTGMGQAEVIDFKKYAKFFGNSLDYEIGIDINHLNLIRQLFPDWTIES